MGDFFNADFIGDFEDDFKSDLEGDFDGLICGYSVIMTFFYFWSKQTIHKRMFRAFFLLYINQKTKIKKKMVIPEMGISEMGKIMKKIKKTVFS